MQMFRDLIQRGDQRLSQSPVNTLVVCRKPCMSAQSSGDIQIRRPELARQARKAQTSSMYMKIKEPIDKC